MAITNITEALEVLRELVENLPEAGGGSGGSNMSYDYGTEDLTAGTSPLETGKLYFVYE